MVSDAYYYAVPLIGAALLVGWLTSPLWGIPVLVLAGFFFWFFRDPDRVIPDAVGVVVSPADGKVTDVAPATDGSPRTRISIFLSVFDVHVNRSPMEGIIRDVSYRKGKFINAIGADSAEQNEQNIVTVEGGGGQILVFKQIAGLLARRIVFTKNVGEHVQRGERVGMIKFGSRVDVLLNASAKLQVKVGDRVKGGASVLAYLAPEPQQLASVGAAQTRQGAL
jgi:phosphatidylserine decarboxylase